MQNAVQQPEAQHAEYPDTYLPVQRTIVQNPPADAYWTRFERSVCNSLNNVFKHLLLLNEHGADGRRTISDFDKTHIFVHYAIDFLCSRNFVIKAKRKKAAVNAQGNRRGRRQRREREEQHHMCVPITARIQKINENTALPHVADDERFHHDVFKRFDLADDSMFVYWTCDDDGRIDALKLQESWISKDQCFCPPINQAEKNRMAELEWEQPVERLIKAVSPFTTDELQGVDPQHKFLRYTTQKRTILSALNAMEVSLNDEDEGLLIGQLTLQESEDADSVIICFLSMRKGHSLIHMNLRNAVSDAVSKDNVATYDVCQLVPQNFRDKIRCLSFVPLTTKGVTFKIINSLVFFGAPNYVTTGHCNMFLMFNWLRNAMARMPQLQSWHQVLKCGDEDTINALIQFVETTLIDGPLKTELTQILRNRILVADNVLVKWRTAISKYASRKDPAAYNYWHAKARQKAVLESLIATEERRHGSGAKNFEVRSLISAEELTAYLEMNQALHQRRVAALRLLATQQMIIVRFSGVEFAMFDDERTRDVLKCAQNLVPQLCAIMAFGGGWYAPNARQIEIEKRRNQQYMEGREFAYFLSNMMFLTKGCNKYISNHVAVLYSGAELRKFSHTFGEIHGEILHGVELGRFDKPKLCDMSRWFHEITRKLAQRENRDDDRHPMDLDSQEGGAAGGEGEEIMVTFNRKGKSYVDRLPILIAHSKEIKRFLDNDDHLQTSQAIYAFYDYMRSVIFDEQEFEVQALVDTLAVLRVGSILKHVFKFGVTRGITPPRITQDAGGTVIIEQLQGFMFDFLAGSRNEYLGATGVMELLVSAMSNILIFSCIICADQTYLPMRGDKVTFREDTQRDDLFEKLNLSVRETDSDDINLSPDAVTKQKNKLWATLRYAYSWVFNCLQIKAANWLILQYDYSMYVNNNRAMCMNCNSDSFILIQKLVNHYEMDVEAREANPEEPHTNSLNEKETTLIRSMRSRPRNIPLPQ